MKSLGGIEKLTDFLNCTNDEENVIIVTRKKDVKFILHRSVVIVRFTIVISF